MTTHEIHIATIAERAMILKLKISKMTRYRQSKAGSRILDTATGKYGAARAQVTLFEKVPMIDAVYTAFQAVYDNWFHQTVPWQDEEGARIIANDLAMDFFAEHRRLSADAESKVKALAPVWHLLVQQDINRLGPLADPKHYPDDPAPLFSISLNPRPIPNTNDFRCAIPQEELDKINAAVLDAEQQAKVYTLGVMMEPVTRAIARLGEYQGEKGQRFHESIITNIGDVLTQAKKLNIMGDPALATLIHEAEQKLRPFLFNPTAVKESQPVREAATKQLNDIAAKMAAFMGGK